MRQRGRKIYDDHYTGGNSEPLSIQLKHFQLIAYW